MCLLSRCVLYSQSPSHESVAIVSYGKNMGWKLSNLFVPEISTKLDFTTYLQFLVWLFTSNYENKILPVKLDLLRRVDWKDLECFDCFLSMGVNSSILPIMRLRSPNLYRWCSFWYVGLFWIGFCNVFFSMPVERFDLIGVDCHQDWARVSLRKTELWSLIIYIIH